MLPLMIDVKDKKVVIVGGGKIAFRRLKLFLEQESNIKVISPTVIKEIRVFVEAGKIHWIKDVVKKEHIQDAFIIIAATNHKEINSWIKKQSQPHQLVNVVHDAEVGNVQVPSFRQEGKLTISVSTNGASPILAKELCSHLFHSIDRALIHQLNEYFNIRKKINGSNLNPEKKKELLTLVLKNNMG